jgi:hypothetical protein
VGLRQVEDDRMWGRGRDHSSNHRRNDERTNLFILSGGRSRLVLECGLGVSGAQVV